MTDKTKCSVVGLDRQPVKIEEEKLEPNPELIEVLEHLLEGANRGYVTELIGVAYNAAGNYLHILAIDEETYDPSFRGHLLEVIDSYRDTCLGYEYEE